MFQWNIGVLSIQPSLENSPFRRPQPKKFCRMLKAFFENTLSQLGDIGISDIKLAISNWCMHGYWIGIPVYDVPETRCWCWCTWWWVATTGWWLLCVQSVHRPSSSPRCSSTPWVTQASPSPTSPSSAPSPWPGSPPTW